MDMLITAGERKATALLCMALHDIGIPADSFTGSQAGFLTDGSHMNAKILELRPDRLREALAAGRTPVVGGSQGVSPDRSSDEHTSELQPLMRISYAVFCLTKKTNTPDTTNTHTNNTHTTH